MRDTQKYALIWKDGSYSVGSEVTIANVYLRRKRLILGLLKLNGHNRLVYSQTQWSVETIGYYQRYKE